MHHHWYNDIMVAKTKTRKKFFFSLTCRVIIKVIIFLNETRKLLTFAQFSSCTNELVKGNFVVALGNCLMITSNISRRGMLSFCSLAFTFIICSSWVLILTSLFLQTQKKKKTFTRPSVAVTINVWRGETYLGNKFMYGHSTYNMKDT